MSVNNHHCHIKPDSEAILWRYMSLEKYESLLNSSALFFCRADKFSDPYECSIPKREFEYRLSPEKFKFEEKVFNRSGNTFDLEIAKKNAAGLSDLHKRVKTATTVNCWHINSNESDAMWQLYLKNNEGIAVRTTVQKLNAVLEKTEEDIGISKVRYIDYEKDVWYHETEFPVSGYNLYTPIIHKRIEFHHEKELRIYHHKSEREKPGYWESQHNNVGHLVKIDIPALIDGVIFHPTANQTIKKRIMEVTEKFGYKFTFEESKLSNEAYY